MALFGRLCIVFEPLVGITSSFFSHSVINAVSGASVDIAVSVDVIIQEERLCTHI